MDKLTERQQDVYDYLVGHIRTEEYSPPMKKIADHFGWSSPNSAMDHMRKIAKKGYVRKTPRGYVPV